MLSRINLGLPSLRKLPFSQRTLSGFPKSTGDIKVPHIHTNDKIKSASAPPESTRGTPLEIDLKNLKLEDSEKLKVKLTSAKLTDVQDLLKTIEETAKNQSSSGNTKFYTYSYSNSKSTSGIPMFYKILLLFMIYKYVDNKYTRVANYSRDVTDYITTLFGSELTYDLMVDFIAMSEGKKVLSMKNDMSFSILMCTKYNLNPDKLKDLNIFFNHVPGDGASSNILELMLKNFIFSDKIEDIDYNLKVLSRG